MMDDKKILLIDDEQDVLEFLQKRLKENHYNVIVASGGLEGLKKSLEEKPDLILLDIIMADKDGFSVLQELKKQNSTKYIPVIMLSAKAETKAIFNSQETGAVDYLIKPFDLQELLKYIRRHI